MKALIFGVTGQDGHYLRELLTREGVSVFGVARNGGDARLDVSDAAAVREILQQIRPHFVFHFAAASTASHEYLWANHAAISTGTLTILDAVERIDPATRVLLVGSGLQFINDGLPLHEQSPLDHSSPYVVARNHSLFAARYFRTRGLKIYFAYLFNHDSPFRSNRHLNMRIAEAAARSARGSRGKLLIGDLDAEKEFNFAGDIVRAIWLLVRQDNVHECVLGSGHSYQVRNWVESCFKSQALDWREHVSINREFQKPYRSLKCDPKVLLGLGWKPTVQFDALRKMMMDEAIERVGTGQDAS